MEPSQSRRLPQWVPRRVGWFSPAFSSRASEALGSVHTDLGDVSRAATKHERNLTRQALKAIYAAVRQRTKEEEEERSRLEDTLGSGIRTLGPQMDEGVPAMMQATKADVLNQRMPLIDALNDRMNEMIEKITTIADSAQKALENLRQNAGSDWSDWSLLEDSDFQDLKERFVRFERDSSSGPHL